MWEHRSTKRSSRGTYFFSNLLELDELDAPTLAQSAAIIGAPIVWATGYTGAGQTVAILDTGVDRNHSFFGGRVVSEACYSTTDPGSSTSVCGATTGTGSAAPCTAAGCDHGTHVAGIAAGSGASFSGVAPAANIIAIQVFSDFGSRGVLAYTSDQILGLQRVYDLRSSFSIAAVNMSLGGGRYTTQAECDGANTTRKSIIDSLRSVGIATVISSGNDGYTDSLVAPGCISSAVSVGSTTDGSAGAPPVDQISSFSNSAAFLTLLAPGHFITSSVPGGGFATYRGTSMASPHVAGAWTLLKSRFSTATVSEVLSALTSTGTGVLDPRNGLIKPRINVNLAMSELIPPGCTFSISPASVSISSAAWTGTVDVTTQAGCEWMAVSNASFIGISSGAAGTGSGTVAYDVGTNAGAQRDGSLTVAGQTFTVTQLAAPAGPGTVRDLNGDGWLDLLWHHQTDGRIVVWSMDGINRVSEPLLIPSQVPDTTWKIAGIGDLDADGNLDLVWAERRGRPRLRLADERPHTAGGDGLEHPAGARHAVEDTIRGGS